MKPAQGLSVFLGRVDIVSLLSSLAGSGEDLNETCLALKSLMDRRSTLAK